MGFLSASRNNTIPKIILFWNSYWHWHYFDMGHGNEGFKNCPNEKNCITTRNRSHLYDPNFIVKAIVFHGVGVSLDELNSLKMQKLNNQLKKWNHGVDPLIVLFMLVSLKSDFLIQYRVSHYGMSFLKLLKMTEKPNLRNKTPLFYYHKASPFHFISNNFMKNFNKWSKS